MPHRGDYGFITRSGIIEDENNKQFRIVDNSQENRLEKKTKSDYINGLQQKQSKLTETGKKSQIKLPENNKTPWWKVIFMGKQKSQLKSLRRHESLDNISKSKTRINTRLRKCKSVMVEESDKVFHGFATSDAPDPKRNTVQEKIKCNNCIFKKTESDFLNQSKQLEDKKSTRGSVISENGGATSDIMIIKEEKNFSKQKSSLKKEEKLKSQKPSKKYLSLKGNKQQCHAMSNKNRPKPEIKRSKSVLSLKSLFHKKSKNKNEKDVVDDRRMAKSSSTDDFLSDIRNKLDFVYPDNHTFNIYEKFPNKKVEQPKYLVHMQTREEIPIRDGVPQWDAESYRYVTHHKPNLDISEKSKKVSIDSRRYLESSFIGNTNLSCTDSGSLHDQATKNENNDEVQMPGREIKNKTNNQQLAGGADLCTDGENIAYYKKYQKFYNKSNDIEVEPVEEGSPTNPPTQADSSLDLHFHAPCLENQDADNHHTSTPKNNLLFGPSFVLTGVSENDEKADTIVLKHPYLAELTPLRHMAKCLRQAKNTNMPSKLSHVEMDDIDLPLPPDSWIECNEIEADPKIQTDLASISAVANKFASLSPTTSGQVSIDSSTGDNLPYLMKQRRCLSDSDLSSFYVTPMKLNERYSSKDQSIERNHSRNSRTKLLLHRMHNRIERLKKLSDSSVCKSLRLSKTALPIPSVNIRNCELSPTSDNTFLPSKSLSNESAQRRLLGTKINKQLPNLRNGGCTETSFKQFKRLINLNLEKGKINKTTTNDKKLEILPKPISKHQHVNSEPLYDFIWPIESNQCTETQTDTKVLQSTIVPTNSSYCNGSSSVSIEDRTFLNHTTKVTFSAANTRPISSILSSEKTEPSYNDANCSLKNCTKQLVKEGTYFDKVNEKSHKDISPIDYHRKFSPPEKGELKDINNIPTFNETTPECSKNEFSAGELKENMLSNFNDQIQIRNTVLEEMKRICSKYSAHEDASHCVRENFEMRQRFNDWKDDLRFQWKDGVFENETGSNSDTSSVTTLKQQDFESESSGDTLINNFDSEETESYWFIGCKTVNYQKNGDLSDLNTKGQNRSIQQYEENDPRNFMLWDCDETDL